MFGGVPCRCIKLEQLQQELVEASQPNLLNVENLNQVIIEALMISCFLLCFPQIGLNKGWYTYDIHFEGGWQGGGGVRQKLDVIRHHGWGIRECSGRPIFIFLLLKKIWFAPWPNVMLSETSIYYCMYSILDWLIFCWGNLIVQKRKWKW